MSVADPPELGVGPKWYKCPNCDTCRNSRKEFLVHLDSHDDTKDGRHYENRPIFHTANGKILRITELANTYTIFTPNIELRPLEDVCRKFELNLKQPTIKVPRLTEADFEAALLLEVKRQKLRAKPKRKYSSVLDIHEDDIFVPGEGDHEDSDDDNFDPHRKHEEPHLVKKKPKRFKKHMTRHIRKVSGPGQPCVPCGIDFAAREEYFVHVTQDHYKDGTYFCSSCPLRTHSRGYFIRHRCAQKSELLRCVICSPMTEWTYRADYKKHVVTHRVNGMYSCGHCPFTSKRPYCLNVHIEREHIGSKSKPHFPRKEKLPAMVPCSICGKLVIRSWLKKHLEVHKRKDEKNKSKAFRCALCNDGFTTKVSLQRHFQLHVENNPYVCKFPGCGKRSSSKYVYREHYELHYGKREFFRCYICNVQYSRKERIEAHNRKFHSGDGDSKPEFRPQRKQYYRAKRVEELPDHDAHPMSFPVYAPPPVLSFPCLREPSEDAPKQEGRVNVGSIHLGDESTIKAECRDAMLNVDEELEARGILKAENPRPSPMQASELDLAIETTEVLEKDPVIKHLEIVNPEFLKLLARTRGTKYTNYGDKDAFPCKICVYPKVSYPRLHHLVSHMKKHHPEEAAESVGSVELSGPELMFTCAACGFQSKTSEDLSIHMKNSHKRKFHCPKCSSRFQTQINLDYHVRIVHMTEKTHKCTTCGKLFATFSNLHSHRKRTHAPPPADPNDLICKQCGQVTSNIKSFKAHVALHSKTRVLSYCKICNEKLSCLNSLRRHIQLVHLKVKQTAKMKATQVIPESELFL